MQPQFNNIGCEFYIQRVPQKGFGSAVVLKLYVCIHYLSIPLYTDPSPFRSTPCTKIQ